MMETMQQTWEGYLNAGGNPDPVAFGVWLIQNKPLITAGKPKRNVKALQKQEAGIGAISNHAMAAIFIGRLERFVHFATKPALKKHAIANSDEFGLLATLFFMKRPTKMQLLKQCLMEVATGSQMLKRMKSEGWILDIDNPDDKRSIFIELSEKGKRLVIDCFSALEGVDDMLEGMNDTEQIQILKLLEKLDHIHSNRQNLRHIKEVMNEG